MKAVSIIETRRWWGLLYSVIEPESLVMITIAFALASCLLLASSNIGKGGART